MDWSKAGIRLRHQPPDGSGHNPDFNWAAQRWKDEADYYSDEMDQAAIIKAADCPCCGRLKGQPCLSRADFCTPRKRAAGVALLKAKGPRFGGRIVDA